MVGRDWQAKDRDALKDSIRGLFSYFRLAHKRLEVMHETPSVKEDNLQALGDVIRFL